VGQTRQGVGQLGHDAQKSALGQQCVRDTDELGHTAIYPAHAGQDVAQNEIEKPLHGGEVVTGGHGH
jgi:hypothetical protein